MLKTKEMPKPPLPANRPGMQEADLPPSDTKRWVMRRKADVVSAVRCGLLTLEQACPPKKFRPGNILLSATAFAACAPPACNNTVPAISAGMKH
jgi:hypothetical protein